MRVQATPFHPDSLPVPIIKLITGTHKFTEPATHFETGYVTLD